MLFVCIKTSAQKIAAEDTTAKPLITAVGKPDGAKAVVKINKGGSSLQSSDGIIELIIPEGAVPKNTTISIQPITNLMANGNGKTYRLEPSGIQFKKPLQLIFHYDEAEIKDSMQLLMGIAMQNEKGQWLSLKKISLDTVKKTISGNINHFSDWSQFDAIKLNPSYGRVQIDNVRVLEVTGVKPDPECNDDLCPLTRQPKKVVWEVNDIPGGNKTVGTIIGRMLGAYYNAPSKVPNQNPVAVTAHLVGLQFPFQGILFKDLKLVSNLLIYDNAYEITIVHLIKGQKNGSEIGAASYQDTGSCVISINGKDAKIIEKINRNTDASLDYSGKCIVTQLKSGSGSVHILGTQNIKVVPPISPGGNAWVEIIFKRAPTIFPLLQFKCPPVGSGKDWYTGDNAKPNAIAASFIQAYPQQVKFEAKEGEQVVLDLNGGEVSVKITVKKLTYEQ